MTEVEPTSRPAAESSPASPGAEAGAGARVAGRPVWAVFLGLAATVVVLDQVTKAWLTSFLAPGESVDVIGDFVRLVHGQNSGGLFGLFSGQALPFAVVSLVVVGLIVAYHARSAMGRLRAAASGREIVCLWAIQAGWPAHGRKQRGV